MPEENSIFMKTSSRALGILTQLHSETAQAMYAYTVVAYGCDLLRRRAYGQPVRGRLSQRQRRVCFA